MPKCGSSSVTQSVQSSARPASAVQAVMSNMLADVAKLRQLRAQLSNEIAAVRAPAAPVGKLNAPSACPAAVQPGSDTHAPRHSNAGTAVQSEAQAPVVVLDMSATLDSQWRAMREQQASDAAGLRSQSGLQAAQRSDRSDTALATTASSRVDIDLEPAAPGKGSRCERVANDRLGMQCPPAARPPVLPSPHHLFGRTAATASSRTSGACGEGGAASTCACGSTRREPFAALSGLSGPSAAHGNVQLAIACRWRCAGSRNVSTSCAAARTSNRCHRKRVAPCNGAAVAKARVCICRCAKPARQQRNARRACMARAAASQIWRASAPEPLATACASCTWRICASSYPQRTPQCGRASAAGSASRLGAQASQARSRDAARRSRGAQAGA